MTERATIFQGVQLGDETVPGTSVNADRKLLGISIQPAVKAEVAKFRPIGMKFPTVAALGKEWVVANIEGIGVYNDLAFLLSSLINYAAPVQQGATAAYLWTFNPDSDGEDTIRTFTVEQGSAYRAHKFTYGLVTALELNFSRGGIEVSGEMIGRALQDNITLTAAPTEVALMPILPTQVDLYLADTQAGLAGASAMSRGMSVSWALRNRFSPLYPLATAPGTGFAVHVEAEPELQVKLKCQADAEGMALLTKLRSGATQFLRIRAVGDLIASTYYYTLQIDTALKLTQEPSAFSDEDGVFAIEWNMDGVHDSTWTRATQILLTNTLTSL